jgi:hypothetical protein
LSQKVKARSEIEPGSDRRVSSGWSDEGSESLRQLSGNLTHI